MSEERLLKIRELKGKVMELLLLNNVDPELLKSRHLSSSSDTPSFPVLDSGDTAWMLCSTALVLFMTLPGLVLYYGGMVRKQNVLVTALHIFSIACMVSFLWLCVGYSFAFGPVDRIPGNYFFYHLFVLLIFYLKHDL